MIKVKLFREIFYETLEKKMNEFISENQVVNIDFKPIDVGGYSAMIIYREGETTENIDKELEEKGVWFAIELIDKINKHFPIFCERESSPGEFVDLALVEMHGESCINMVFKF